MMPCWASRRRELCSTGAGTGTGSITGAGTGTGAGAGTGAGDATGDATSDATGDATGDAENAQDPQSAEAPERSRASLARQRKKEHKPGMATLPDPLPLTTVPAARQGPSPLDDFDEEGFMEVVKKSVPAWREVWQTMSMSDMEKAEAGLLAQPVVAPPDTSLPLPRVQKLDEQGRAFGRGGRKTAVASVWIKPGSGKIHVNKRDLAAYFNQADWIKIHAVEPLVLTRQIGNFDVWALVQGGGTTGQSGAVRHGLARALQNYNPEWRKILKPAGMLTRDPRMVEKKKGGRKKARKSFTFVKR